MNISKYCMNFRWQSWLCTAVSCAMLFISGATSVQASNQSMEFALIGDMPYNAKQKAEYENLIKDINAQDLAFVVHAGDYWFDGIAWKKTTRGLPPCSDETMQDRMKSTQTFRHPFILTPGDNDWTDCHRAKPRAYDPLERLAKLRKMFFNDDRSLGKRTIRLTRQSKNSKYAKFSENARWTHGGVMFVTLHMTGSNNNLGRTPEMDAEYEERNTANLTWMDETFKEARRNGSRAVMIFAQANPQFETNWIPKVQKRYMLQGLGIEPPKTRRDTGFNDFIEALEEHTVAFGKPVAYLHGDTHTFRIDKPLFGSISQRMIENFTRVETFGFSDTHWVKVTIDPSDPNVFRFTPQIVEQNRVRH